MLFDAEKKDEKSPDLSGEIFDKRLAGWKALTKFDKPMLQMRVRKHDQSPKNQNKNSQIKGNKQII